MSIHSRTRRPGTTRTKASEDLAKAGLRASGRMAVDRNNALRLFPRVKG
jgi:hypothetical protein